MTRHPSARTDDLRLHVFLRSEDVAALALDGLAAAWATDRDAVEEALDALAAAVGDGENAGGTLADVRAAREELAAIAGLPEPETRMSAGMAMHLADQLHAAASRTRYYGRGRHLRAV
ncbi:hypothetical protein [Streptomyces sp. NPDC050738]|uniref:hypothetical protein n=1 Tax=Streptomyces sp. NPDC050738 TaxID=3154744 RepID=UPI0034180411